jgi:tRNA U34 2-thiouridine synthase MnmA/TrmU
MDKPNGTPCIRDMCCNQFGERDEMQHIINSLQADVIARGARIKMLEDERDELQRRFDHNARV